MSLARLTFRALSSKINNSNNQEILDEAVSRFKKGQIENWQLINLILKMENGEALKFSIKLKKEFDTLEKRKDLFTKLLHRVGVEPSYYDFTSEAKNKDFISLVQDLSKIDMSDMSQYTQLQDRAIGSLAKALLWDDRAADIIRDIAEEYLDYPKSGSNLAHESKGEPIDDNRAGDNGFYTPEELNLLAETTKLEYRYIQECYELADGRFKRINNLQDYIHNHNWKRKDKPALSLEQALATTLKESINLQRCYPLINDKIIKIEQARKFSDQELDNVTGIGIGIVREGLLPLDTVLSLTKKENDFIYNNFIKYGSIKAGVEVFKKYKNSLKKPEKSQVSLQQPISEQDFLTKLGSLKDESRDDDPKQSLIHKQPKTPMHLKKNEPVLSNKKPEKLSVVGHSGNLVVPAGCSYSISISLSPLSWFSSRGRLGSSFDRNQQEDDSPGLKI